MRKTKSLSTQVAGICCVLLAAFLVVTTQPVIAQGTTNAYPPEVVQMDGKTITKTIPDEAIPVVDLRLGSGKYPGCMDYPETPVINYKTDQMDMTGIALISTCGWAAGEVIKITLMEPKGKFYTYETQAVPSKNRSDLYQADIYFQPGVDAPEGKYRFTIQGSAPRETGSIIKTHVFFNHTDGARFYAQSENRFEPVLQPTGSQHSLRLDQFLPDEWIRLFVYRVNGTKIEFYAWQDVHADSTGRLTVEVNLPEIDDDTALTFYAYGLETHSVHLERFTPEGLRVNRQFEMDLYCPGALPPRLAEAAALQAADGVEIVSIYRQPGFGSRIISRQPADVTLRIYGQPKCIDRAFWWRVAITDPILFGWTPESFLGRYRVEAVK